MPTQRHPAILLIAVLAALVCASPAFAQDDLTISTLRISIWPEYDQRSALVFYTGQVSDNTLIPIELEFTLPESSLVHAVAFQIESGQLVNADFTTRQNTLVMVSPNGTFHIEFYDSSLQFDDELRHYELTWLADYSVDVLIWEVQEPAGASDMAITPGISTLHSDELGLNLYRNNAGRVPAGTPASIAVSYTKPTDALTIDQISIVPAPTAPRGISTGMLLAIIIGGIVLVSSGAYYLGRRKRREAASAQQAVESALPVEHSDLTERELEVLKLVAEGLMNKDIGQQLGISPRTVARHRENIMGKLDLHSRTDLVKYAIRIGLIDIEAGDE